MGNRRCLPLTELQKENPHDKSGGLPHAVPTLPLFKTALLHCGVKKKKKTTALFARALSAKLHWGQSWGRMAWVFKKNGKGQSVRLVVSDVCWSFLFLLICVSFYFFTSLPSLLSLRCSHSGAASRFQGKFTGKKFARVRLCMLWS